MAFLLVQPGTDAERRIEIDSDEVTIGRAPENKVVINDSSVSGQHCVILRNETKYSLRDLGSTNGTAINDFSVRESRLKPGDMILVGNVEVRFDGTDVEIDELTPGEGAGTAARPATVRTTSSPAPFPFGKKRDSRRLWNVVMVVAIVLAVAAATFFITRLISNG